jgi:hypothetical protein
VKRREAWKTDEVWGEGERAVFGACRNEERRRSGIVKNERKDECQPSAGQHLEVRPRCEVSSSERRRTAGRRRAGGLLCGERSRSKDWKEGEKNRGDLPRNPRKPTVGPALILLLLYVILLPLFPTVAASKEVERFVVGEGERNTAGGVCVLTERRKE